MTFVKSKNLWSMVRLVVGIISVLLFFVLGIQSFAVLVDKALSPNKDVSGMVGILAALFLLVAGIIGIITWRAKSIGGVIACIALYVCSAITTFFGTEAFNALKLWGVVAFLFALVYLFALMNTRNEG